MGQALGQPVIVEHRPGASGIIGATAVAKQLPADGHTFLLGDMTTYAVNPSLFEKLTYDPLMRSPCALQGRDAAGGCAPPKRRCPR